MRFLQTPGLTVDSINIQEYPMGGTVYGYGPLRFSDDHKTRSKRYMKSFGYKVSVEKRRKKQIVNNKV